MAVKISGGSRWYEKDRLLKTWSNIRRLPLISIFLLMFVIVLPALFANWIAPHHPEVGVLDDILIPPAWIDAKVEVAQGQFSFDQIQVFDNDGILAPNATVIDEGEALNEAGKKIRRVTYIVPEKGRIWIEPAFIYPGGIESTVTSKTAGIYPPVNIVDFDNGGMWIGEEEVQEGIAWVTGSGGVTFNVLGANLLSRSAGDVIQALDKDGNVVEGVVGRVTIQRVGFDGTEEEILAQSGVIRQISPDGVGKYLLGTDRLGRDLVSRMIYGARISLEVSLIAILFAGFIGTALGLISGYVGGWTDAIIMRLVDMMLSFPAILLALALVAVLGAGFSTVIIVIALVLWAGYARLVRGETLSVKTRDYVQRAKVAGTSPVKILIRHVFPNVLNSLLILATLQLGTVIIFEASLSFLGAGIPRPTPSWGTMVAEGRQLIVSDRGWWVSFFSGMAILIAVLSLNLFGDWVRDKLDPRTRQV